MVLSDNAASGSWGADGYLVFLRRNGALGIYKAGTGQVVADVATGTDPRTAGVRIRVVKTHANLQVFVGENADPLVNWTDPSAPQWSVGAFGLANLRGGRRVRRRHLRRQRRPLSNATGWRRSATG